MKHSFIITIYMLVAGIATVFAQRQTAPVDSTLLQENPALDRLLQLQSDLSDFVFKDETLESIMDKLARWYDLEVFFQNGDLRDVRLSGNLKRYKDVRELFRSFEKISEARFSVNGKTVVIGK